MRELDPLADLLDSAPISDVERASRWSAAVEAVRSLWPGPDGMVPPEPRTLRIVFLAIELWVFRAGFLALLDTGPHTLWGWRLGGGENPCDAWFEADEVEGSWDAGNGWIQEPEIGIEVVVHGERFEAACRSPAGDGSIRFDDHEAASPAAALVGALGRRMLRIAAWRSADGPGEVDAAEERLRTAFGSGPVPPAPRPSSEA